MKHLPLYLSLFFGAASVSAKGGEFLASSFIVEPPAGAIGLCANYPWACATGFGGSLSQDQVALAIQVNTQVNRTTREISDMAQYGKEEVWALPTQRGGDCEDFALLKKLELIRLGLPPETLLIATVLDPNLVSHAVLVLRAPQGDYVLDNLTDKVLLWHDTGHTFLRMQNPIDPRSWVHPK